MKRIFLALLITFLTTPAWAVWDLTEGEGTDLTESGSMILIDGEDATTSNKGIASFSSDNFAVSSGAVTIKDNGVALGTETTGGYAASATEGGSATSLAADALDALTEIDQDIKTAANDTSKIVVGTAGSTDECAKWDANGNLVTAGAACGSGSGGGAPTDATYITQTTNGSLSAEQALSSLSTGIMRVATTTGVITSLTNSAGIADNISNETGSGALVFGTAPTITTSLSFNAVTDTIAGIQNQNLVDKAAAEDISGDWEWQDNTAVVFGNDADFKIEFSSITGTLFIADASGNTLFDIEDHGSSATVTINGTMAVTTSGTSYIILRSPDASCSQCVVDNSDNFSCSSITCP